MMIKPILPFKRRKLSHELIGLTIVYLFIYLLLSPLVLPPLYNFLLFHPDKKAYPQVDNDLQKVAPYFKANMQNVWFSAADHKKIHAWYFEVPSADRTFLVSHGNGGNISYRTALIASLLKCGGSVLIYDYEGYGKSEGSPTRENICLTGQAAYDYLVKDKHVDPRNIILYGESMGCGVTCHISKVCPASGIILQSGWTSLLDAGREKFKLLWAYPPFFFVGPRLDNLAVLSEPHPPALLIHGEKDNVLSSSYSKKLYAKASPITRLLLLPDAGHNNVGIVNQKLYIQGIMDFLTNLKNGNFN